MSLWYANCFLPAGTGAAVVHCTHEAAAKVQPVSLSSADVLLTPGLRSISEVPIGPAKNGYKEKSR